MGKGAPTGLTPGVWDKGVERALGEALGEDRLATITTLLSVAPLTTCLRVNTSNADSQQVLRLLLEAARREGVEPGMHPYAHPLVPEAIMLPGSGPHAVDYSSAGHREVVVVRKAGEAILRGAEVFVPGVLATSSGLEPGDVVTVSAALEEADTGRHPFSRGYRLGSNPELEAAAAGRRRLGLGICQMSRADMFRSEKGVAVTLTSRVHRPGATTASLAPGATMLQNLPSLAAALALDPAPGSRVLDACAAPGGKTTALAAALARGDAGGQVVALDRSHSKVARIRRLAEEAGVAKFVTAYVGDARRCVRRPEPSERRRQAEAASQSQASPSQQHKAPSPQLTPPAGMSEGLRRRLERQAKARERHGQQPKPSAHVAEGQEARCPEFDPGSFDHVLCDVPCTALGQRPRLQHSLTLEELHGTPQYQRSILAAGVAALRTGGTLVFSTCTISHLENEANVRWLLDNHQLKLVPASPRLGGRGLVGPGNCPPLLTEEEAGLVQRFDMGSDLGLDTIGFFIAKFEKMGGGQ